MSDELEALKRKKLLELLQRSSLPKGVVHLDDNDFDSFIKRYQDIPILLDFWSEWCYPCLAMAPIFESFATKYLGKAIFAKVNVDKAPATAAKYKVMAIPTFIMLINSSVKERILGAVGGRLEEHIVKYVSQ